MKFSLDDSKTHSVSINGNNVTAHHFHIDNPVIVQFLNSHESPEIGLQRFFYLWTQVLELVDEPDRMSQLTTKEWLELMQNPLEDKSLIEVMLPTCSLQTLDKIRIIEIPDAL